MAPHPVVILASAKKKIKIMSTTLKYITTSNLPNVVFHDHDSMIHRILSKTKPVWLGRRMTEYGPDSDTISSWSLWMLAWNRKNRPRLPCDSKPSALFMFPDTLESILLQQRLICEGSLACHHSKRAATILDILVGVRVELLLLGDDPDECQDSW